MIYQMAICIILNRWRFRCLFGSNRKKFITITIIIITIHPSTSLSSSSKSTSSKGSSAPKFKFVFVQSMFKNRHRCCEPSSVVEFKAPNWFSPKRFGIGSGAFVEWIGICQFVWVVGGGGVGTPRCSWCIVTLSVDDHHHRRHEKYTISFFDKIISSD